MKPIKWLIQVVFLVVSFNGICQKTYDVVIYGGTAGGITASIQVSKMGKTLALLEPSNHIGGMSVEGLSATKYYKSNYWPMGRCWMPAALGCPTESVFPKQVRLPHRIEVCANLQTQKSW